MLPIRAVPGGLQGSSLAKCHLFLAASASQVPFSDHAQTVQDLPSPSYPAPRWLWTGIPTAAQRWDCKTEEPYFSQAISRKLDLRSNSYIECGSQTLLVSGQQYQEVKANQHRHSLLCQSISSVASAAVSVSTLIPCCPRSCPRS